MQQNTWKCVNGHYELLTATVYSGLKVTYFPERVIDVNKVEVRERGGFEHDDQARLNE
jgi:hypothetical protein